ncbi:hypothetical protein [Leptospira bandrabouensis]|uniref:Uncharacterized protein n=1 Tax=Leptospira bandrabouensis TaxID=2484903 RepID=A0A6H3NQJ4_9LEPT|nr:hypothetical protein [Leptospira bandrabouensis]TGN10339.1 hypothetical protein EHR08_19450 [Leptospira bandrabouensis]
MAEPKRKIEEILEFQQRELEKQRLQYKSLLLEQKRLHSKRDTVNNLSKIGVFLNLVFALLVFITFGLNLVDKGVSKTEIQTKLLLPIQNGASISVLKEILESSLQYKSNLFKSKENLYLEAKPPTLETVIKDIITNNFQKKDFDQKYNQKLNKLLIEFKQKDPFDKLGSKQRDLFENVRLKSKDYPTIQSDMVKIADELDISNQLVNEYLNDGKKSFWISAIGLALAIIIGVIQTYLAIDSRKSSARQYGNIITNLLRSKR